MRTCITILAAAIALFGFATTADAGKVFISGHDSDDGGHVATSFGTQMLDFIGTGNTNGGSGILLLGGTSVGGTTTSRANFNVWNLGANGGAGFTLTQVESVADIGTVDFSSFAGIFMPSAITQTFSGGMTQDQLNAINARAADIAAFVNGGGNLGAFTQAGLTNAFGWFPLGTLSIDTGFGVGYGGVVQTPELAAAGFIATNADLNGDLYHNTFTGPAGFFGLEVLATDSQGVAAILGGGTQTQIQAPEPAFMALLVVGLAGIGLRRRLRRS